MYYPITPSFLHCVFKSISKDILFISSHFSWVRNPGKAQLSWRSAKSLTRLKSTCQRGCIFFPKAPRLNVLPSSFRLLAKFSSLQLGERGLCFIPTSQGPDFALRLCPRSSCCFTCNPSSNTGLVHTLSISDLFCMLHGHLSSASCHPNL